MAFSEFLADSLFCLFFAEPATIGRVGVQCCLSNGCLLRLSWKGYLHQKQTHGALPFLLYPVCLSVL